MDPAHYVPGYQWDAALAATTLNEQNHLQPGNPGFPSQSLPHHNEAPHLGATQYNYLPSTSHGVSHHSDVIGCVTPQRRGEGNFDNAMAGVLSGYTEPRDVFYNQDRGTPIDSDGDMLRTSNRLSVRASYSQGGGANSLDRAIQLKSEVMGDVERTVRPLAAGVLHMTPEQQATLQVCAVLFDIWLISRLGHLENYTFLQYKEYIYRIPRALHSVCKK